VLYQQIYSLETGPSSLTLLTPKPATGHNTEPVQSTSHSQNKLPYDIMILFILYWQHV